MTCYSNPLTRIGVDTFVNSYRIPQTASSAHRLLPGDSPFLFYNLFQPTPSPFLDLFTNRLKPFIDLKSVAAYYRKEAWKFIEGLTTDYLPGGYSGNRTRSYQSYPDNIQTAGNILTAEQNSSSAESDQEEIEESDYCSSGELTEQNNQDKLEESTTKPWEIKLCEDPKKWLDLIKNYEGSIH